jgi:hypothetical protein
LKASPILLYATGDMRHVPDQERQALRRLFTQHLRGVDAQHQRRALRLIGDFLHATAGEGFQLYRAEERSGPFHRYHQAVLSALFERQERYRSKKALHDWLKLQCWFVEWVSGYPEPRSTDFDSCSEDDIREFNADLKDLLHMEATQLHFWPHLPERLRHEQVQGILTNPERTE